jgi:molecular chaperone DnaJ
VEKIIELTRDELCQECDGSGARPGSRVVKCTTCGGTGELRQEKETILGKLMQVETCKTCNGKGEIIQTPCKKCNGKGVIGRKVRREVKIPAGVNTGMKVRLAGEGQPGMKGQPNGNLYLDITVSEHPLFSREGDDLHLVYPLTNDQARKGGSFKIPTLVKGKPVQLKITPGYSENSTFTIKEQGVPKLREASRGNLVVSLKIYDPNLIPPDIQQKLKLIREYIGR